MSARKTPKRPPDFDFSEYLFLLERVLPKRSKARKLIPELEAYVGRLRERGRRPWEHVNVNYGNDRDLAATAMFESVMKIPPEFRYRLAVEPAMEAAGLDTAPPEVIKEVETLCQRERYWCYIKPFIMLRLKGEVTLTDERSPVPGSVYERSGSNAYGD